MLRMNNISFNVVEKNKNEVEGPFYGLTFLEADWGEINRPIRVANTKELVEKIGDYSDDNKNDFFQCYNFLAYSKNLKIYRIAPLTATPIFDGSDDLSSVTGSLNAHLFIGSENDATTYVHNSSDNGSTLYLKLNDIYNTYTLPSFAAAQKLFVSAKYAGCRGNNIGISIANYYTTLTTNIFSEYHEIQLFDATGYSVTDVIVGDTSGATGTVKDIKFNTLYVEVSDGEFQDEETIDTGTAMIKNIYNPPDINYSFSELFNTTLNIDDVAIVITLGNEILEKKICSLDILKDNYIELWENNWIDFYLPSNYSKPLSTDSESTIKDKIPYEILNNRLMFGTNDSLDVDDINTQINKLKDPNRYDFDILFVDRVSTTLETKLQEIIDSRNNCLLIINKLVDLTEDEFLLISSGDYLLQSDDSGKIILVG